MLLEDLRTYLNRLEISSGYVFYAGDNDTHLSPDTVSKIFKEAAESAGVELEGRSLKSHVSQPVPAEFPPESRCVPHGLGIGDDPKFLPVR